MSLTRPFRYPYAPPDDLTEVLHGISISDPYRWLEEPASERTLAWCAAQDALARDYLEGLPERDVVRQRVRELARIGAVLPVAVRGDRVFYLRREGDQEHPILMVREPDGPERVLIDPSALSPDLTITLDYSAPSLEGTRLAYGLSEGGTEEATLHVLDVVTGRDHGERIDRTRYSSIAWLPGGEAFYYVRRLAPDRVPAGEAQFHRRVYLHRLGADPGDDQEIFGDGRDPRSFYVLSLSPDGRWLIVHARVGTDDATDVYLADLRGDGRLRPVIEGVDARTTMQIREGRLYVHTNLDAPRYRIAVADPSDPARWHDLVPETDAVIEEFAVAAGAVIVNTLVHATSRVRVHDGSTGELWGDASLPGLGTAYGFSADPMGGGDVFFGFTSFTTPPQVLRLHVPMGGVFVWGAPSGAPEADAFEVRQGFVRSRDDTLVPAFIVKARGARADGTACGMLTGYGGFNINRTPVFLGPWLDWIERGGVYVLANLRGGGEYGETWHRAGMREHKQNVFDDYLAVAGHLVAAGEVAPGRLAALGGSNGGLLVGAALTQRPELFRTVVCSAPLLDMVRYERFALGRLWTREYGSVEDPEALRWLFAYSPYHRVVDGTAYPAVLFKTYESDTRVDPVHARKMTARLQAASSSGHPVLLRRETHAGHAMKSLSRVVDDVGDTLAFLYHELGLLVR